MVLWVMGYLHLDYFIPMHRSRVGRRSPITSKSILRQGSFALAPAGPEEVPGHYASCLFVWQNPQTFVLHLWFCATTLGCCFELEVSGQVTYRPPRRLAFGYIPGLAEPPLSSNVNTSAGFLHAGPCAVGPEEIPDILPCVCPCGKIRILSTCVFGLGRRHWVLF